MLEVMALLVLLNMSKSPDLLAEDLSIKSIVCLGPQIDYQYSSCFLLFQALITPLATSATNMLRAGSVPAGGCEKPHLVN